MSSPIQRRAWKKLTEIPAGQRTAAVCRMVCEYKGQQELLDAVRQTIRQELRGVQLTKEEAQDSGGAGDVDESVLVIFNQYHDIRCHQASLYVIQSAISQLFTRS